MNQQQPSLLLPGAFFCRTDEFVCNNTLCKLHAWVCDGRDDCGDNSDEDQDMCGGSAFKGFPSDFLHTIVFLHPKEHNELSWRVASSKTLVGPSLMDSFWAGGKMVEEMTTQAFSPQPNTRALPPGRSVAATTACACARTRCATRWTTAETTRTRRSVVSTRHMVHPLRRIRMADVTIREIAFIF